MEKYVRKKLELAYHAHVFDVYNDYLDLPDGREVVYDYIDHRAGACVLPVTDDGKILMVRQYRNALNRETYIYIGYDLRDGCMSQDMYENIESEIFDVANAENMIRDGRIVDSKTIIAVYAYINSLK